MHFHGHHLDRWRAYIAMIHNPITTNREPCAIWGVLFWSIRDHHLSVHDVPPPVERYFAVLDEDNGVCTFCSRYTLG
jgi:hypothetical protein